MPSTRTQYECWLLGQVDDVLSNEWLTKFNAGESSGATASTSKPIFCFNLKPKLPTQMQVLKLLMFYKKSESFKNSSIGSIADIVLEDVYNYWRAANIPGIAHWRAKKHVIELFTKYRTMMKKKNRETEGEIQRRDNYIAELNKLFDIASPEAENILRNNRLLKEDSKS